MLYKILLPVLAILGLAFITCACSSSKPDSLGVTDGKLSPCPESPNCVLSQASDKEHAIAPLSATGSTGEVMKQLKGCLEKIDGLKNITIEGPYLHAEFSSKVFRFVDDLECFYNAGKGQIEIRSAARLGYTDFSVNRKRVEILRRLFEAQKR
ncbi:DUF1499 domain-containing protein [Maridesulfovibrio hydrothermalis]|nr:DUF1499 domain-containing protein [Maridesulfovibrio hydrothermalis]